MEIISINKSNHYFHFINNLTYIPNQLNYRSLTQDQNLYIVDHRLLNSTALCK